MTKLYRIRFIKDTELKKVGDIANCSKKSAEETIRNGYAEYDILNQEQEKAIELQVTKPHLKELAENELKIGRQKQTERIIEDMNKKEFEDFHEAKENYEYENMYLIKMRLRSLLAQKKFRLATEMIVQFIMKMEHIYTTRDDLKSEIWVYEGGIYKPQGKSYIKEYCRKLLEENFNSYLYNETINKIEADTYIDIDKFFKDDSTIEIPIEDGILNVKTKEVSPFNPKRIFFNKLPLKYNKDATCPNIKKFFADVLKSPDDVKVMFELFGYCLLKEYKYEKAFMFVGNGRNGKGKTLSLLKRFLGAENCCSIALSQINAASSSVCELYGRLGNFAGDISNHDLKDTGMIKAVTGRDLINAKRKFLRDLIFVNYAKLIFACNELPKVYDTSLGFWSRWILLEFPYTFVNKEELNENKNNRLRDESIIEKITSQEEMSGLLNEALIGLDRLEQNQDFSYSKGTKEIKEMWVRQADSFMAFCMDYIVEDYEGMVSKKELRKYFSKYCKSHKLKGASDVAMKVILENSYGVIEHQDWDTRERFWEGIKLKDTVKLFTTQTSQGF
jgi:putative DNA primase/helicase